MSTAAVTTGPSILDFSFDVQLYIIWQLKNSNTDITPFITCCKSLYSRFSVLIRSLVEVDEVIDHRFNTRNTTGNRLLHSLLAGTRLVTSCLTSLCFKSVVPRFLVKKSYLYSHLPFILQTTTNLRNLEINCNSLLIFCRTVAFLPQNVTNLCLTLENHGLSMRLNEPLETELALAIASLRRRSTTSSLKQLEIRIGKGPKFITDSGRATQLISQAIRSFQASNVMELRVNVARAMLLKSSHEAILLISHVIFLILFYHRNTLKSVLFERFDVDLVYSFSKRPFTMPKLRLFQFDCTSYQHWLKWYYDLELINLDNEGFEGLSVPVMVYEHRMVPQLPNTSLRRYFYMKLATELQPAAYLSHDVRSRQPEMMYWKSSLRKPITRQSLYKMLGLQYVFHRDPELLKTK